MIKKISKTLNFIFSHPTRIFLFQTRIFSNPLFFIFVDKVFFQVFFCSKNFWIKNEVATRARLIVLQYFFFYNFFCEIFDILFYIEIPELVPVWRENNTKNVDFRVFFMRISRFFFSISCEDDFKNPAILSSKF